MRKICLVVTSRASYARVKYVMKAIREHPALKLQLILGASSLLYRFGSVAEIVEREGFKADRHIYYVLEGQNLSTMAKSTGLGIVELSTAFQDLKPDMIITVADRFETMATAIAATYMNIPLVHIQGGELSGNIDDSVRHAVTKMANIHFPATEVSRERLIKMGEDPEFVFNYGCPSMDILVNEDLTINNELMKKYGGTGSPVEWEKPYFLVLQHPVTTSYGKGFQQITETLEALKLLKKIQKIVLWPNADAGTEDVSKGIRVFRSHNEDKPFHYYRNFTPEDYARVINNAVCLVGNSSSFIREGSFLGVPAVIIGDRQNNREYGKNIVFAGYDREKIYCQVKKQLHHGKYKPERIFGDGTAGKRIAEKLATIPLTIHKKYIY